MTKRHNFGPGSIRTAIVRNPLYPAGMTDTGTTTDTYTIRSLGADTWDAFADLAERHNGVWGGCWCTFFHTFEAEKTHTVEGNRALKERLVREGKARAALVFDGDVAVAWCEYGTPAELPNINHRKQYEAELVRLPDYRITCFFVDRRYRRKGVSALALRGALDLIAQAGGGIVEAYPQDTEGNKVSASFLYNSTRTLFEGAGFAYDRPKGKNHTVMSRTVAPAT
jgi:GNAT superfamily N-acetyltransferase